MKKMTKMLRMIFIPTLFCSLLFIFTGCDKPGSEISFQATSMSLDEGSFTIVQQAELSEPSEGQYIGTTSQGMRFSLWVEKVNDHYLISAVRYRIRMESTEKEGVWSYDEPLKRDVPIENNLFRGVSSTGTMTEILEGRFYGNIVEGQLSCANFNPVGLKTVLEAVTFMAVLDKNPTEY